MLFDWCAFLTPEDDRGDRIRISQFLLRDPSGRLNDDPQHIRIGEGGPNLLRETSHIPLEDKKKDSAQVLKMLRKEKRMKECSLPNQISLCWGWAHHMTLLIFFPLRRSSRTVFCRLASLHILRTFGDFWKSFSFTRAPSSGKDEHVSSVPVDR